MIRRHDANSEWWGAPVGVLDDLAFLALDEGARERAVAPWAWIELRVPSVDLPEAARLRAAGFDHVDTQISFRIDLRRVAVPASAAGLDVTFADADPSFVVGHAAAFEAERVRALPGVSTAFVNARYERWARALAGAHPGWALAVRSAHRIEGWFLAEPSAGPLRLTLAMLAADASISGALLYARALAAFAERGARVGEASFSARNTAVLNVYASLGARFTETREIFMRLGPSFALPVA